MPIRQVEGSSRGPTPLRVRPARLIIIETLGPYVALKEWYQTCFGEQADAQMPSPGHVARRSTGNRSSVRGDEPLWQAGRVGANRDGCMGPAGAVSVLQIRAERGALSTNPVVLLNEGQRSILLPRWDETTIIIIIWDNQSEFCTWKPGADD